MLAIMKLGNLQKYKGKHYAVVIAPDYWLAVNTRPTIVTSEYSWAWEAFGSKGSIIKCRSHVGLKPAFS